MKWLHFILSHSIFIAICAVGIAYQSILICPTKVNFWIMGFVFFATLTSYNSYWLLSKNSKFTSWFISQKKDLLFIGTSVIFTTICFIQSNLKPQLLFLAIILNGLYILPVLPFKQLAFTKKVGFLKTLVLAFTWAYVTVVLPLNKPFLYFDNPNFLLFTYRFLFMLLLCIMFDSRDVAIDKIKGLHSIATDSKPLQLKILVACLFALLSYVVFLMHDNGVSNNITISLIIAIMVLGIFYFLSLKKQGYFFYYFFVDGLMLFSGLVTYMASI
jgi:hypothetical protein